MTGDIDLTSPVQSELEEELIRLGFTKPNGIGHPTLGWIHPGYGWGSRWLPARRWMERRIRRETGNEHGIAGSMTEEPQAWAGRVIRHDAFAGILQARREALGEPDMPRNAGNRRTLSKVALLDAIKGVGGDWLLWRPRS